MQVAFALCLKQPYVWICNNRKQLLKICLFHKDMYLKIICFKALPLPLSCFLILTSQICPSSVVLVVTLFILLVAPSLSVLMTGEQRLPAHKVRLHELQL